MGGEESIRDMLLQGSERSIDAHPRWVITKFDDKPTAIQWLELLDSIVRYASADPFVHRVAEIMFEQAMKEEAVTRDDLAPLAWWRSDEASWGPGRAATKAGAP